MMRVLLFALFALSAFEGWSQTSYIVDKKGEKTIVRDDAIEILVIDDRISYKIPGKTWEKYIRFKDLDSAVVGRHIFKSFKVNKKGSPVGYFVLAYHKGNKLLGKAITTTGKNYSITHVYYKVLDKNDMELGKAEFSLRASDKKKDEAVALVKQYFGNCPEISAYLPNDIEALGEEAFYHTCK